MLVVNFFGGPDSGKSTMAAAVFANLKFKEIDCECVQEYAKDKVWEKSFEVLKDQIYVFGKQLHRLKRLEGQVKVVFMDSPILLSALYDSSKNHLLHKLILQEFHKFNNLNFFLKRRELYHQSGRIHSAAEAKQKDAEILGFLELHNIPFIEILSQPSSIDLVVEQINNLTNIK